MDQIFFQLGKFIDIRLLILIVIGSYWYKKNLSDLKISFLSKISLSHQILIWSTILSGAYFFILKHLEPQHKENYVELIVTFVITYFAATSFYELLWRPIQDFIERKFGNKLKDAQ